MLDHLNHLNLDITFVNAETREEIEAELRVLDGEARVFVDGRPIGQGTIQEGKDRLLMVEWNDDYTDEEWAILQEAEESLRESAKKTAGIEPEREVTQELLDAIAGVLEREWGDEITDYNESGRYDGHHFENLVVLENFLSQKSRTTAEYADEAQEEDDPRASQSEECPDCGGDLDFLLEVCPECGYDLNESDDPDAEPPAEFFSMLARRSELEPPRRRTAALPAPPLRLSLPSPN